MLYVYGRMQLSDLLTKAMASVREGITISDARRTDNPLIYVNEAFLRMTGYSQLEAVNYNCRYLQGPDTDRDTVSKIRNSIRERTPLVVELLNYKKTGEPFWNNLSITPLFDSNGEVTHYIGIQDDISTLKHQRDKRAAAERKQAVTAALLKGEETERHRIGMDLHDNISQLLGSAKLYLSLANDPLRTNEAIANCNNILDESIREVRSLSHKLVKPAFTQAGFSAEIQELLETFRNSTSIRTDFNAMGLEATILPEPTAMVIFRVLQEQLNNIRKYSQATVVTVDLVHKGNTIYFSVTDNGVGFNPASVTGGIGLTNMRTRVESINGSIFLESSPHNGAAVHVTIPS